MSLFSGLFDSGSAGGGIFASSSQFKQEITGTHGHGESKQEQKKRKHVPAAAAAAAAEVAPPAAAEARPKDSVEKQRVSEVTEQGTKGRGYKKQKLHGKDQPPSEQQQQRGKTQPEPQLKLDKAAASKQRKAHQTSAAAGAAGTAGDEGDVGPKDTAAAGSAAQKTKGKKAKASRKQGQKSSHEATKHQTAPGPPAAAATDGGTAAAAAAATDGGTAAATPQAPPDPEAEAKAAAEKLSRTIFVGNLPVSIKPKQLKKLFSEFGAVDSVRLRSVPLDMEAKQKLPRKAAVIRGMVTGERGGAKAYVVFAQQQSVQPALAKNMTVLDGHHIRVDTAAQPAAAAAAGGAKGADAPGVTKGVTYEPSRSIFIGNLDFTVSEEQVIEAFANMEVPHVTLPEGQDTHVEAVRVVRDPNTNMGIGVAYVLFKTKAAARSALELNATPLNKRPMRISRINKQPTGKLTVGGRGAAGAGQHSKGSSKRPGSGAPRPAGRNGPAGGLGVRQGGVQKRLGRPAAAAGDWQGLRTKGKGAKLRGPKQPAADAGGSSRGGNPGRGGAGGPHKGGGKAKGKVGSSKAQKGKRPAVAARKAAQRSKAAAAKKK